MNTNFNKLLSENDRQLNVMTGYYVHSVKKTTHFPPDSFKTFVVSLEKRYCYYFCLRNIYVCVFYLAFKTRFKKN